MPCCAASTLACWRGDRQVHLLHRLGDVRVLRLEKVDLRGRVGLGIHRGVTLSAGRP